MDNNILHLFYLMICSSNTKRPQMNFELLFLVCLNIICQWTRFYETPTGYGIAQMATNGNHGKVVYHMREILRLEPRFDDEVLPADENSKVEEAEEKKE
ncbi:hypothetical protein Tco_0950694 [Tanacetum coccineum]